MKLARLIPAAGLAAAAMAVLATPALANEELAKKHACTACHGVDKKIIGPGYNEVAAKYRKEKDQKKVKAMLAEKVKKGGTGTWGQIPMPPNTNVPDADIEKLVTWVMSIK